MSEFPIRSLQFKNANDLNFTDLETIQLLGIDSGTKDFTRVPIDNIIANKITSDLLTEGMGFELKSDKYFHIIKDYTTQELMSLNFIDTYTLNIVDNSKATCTSCSTTCISVGMAATGYAGCKACGSACVDTCNSSCGSYCSTECETICWGTCSSTCTNVVSSANLIDDSAEFYGG